MTLSANIAINGQHATHVDGAGRGFDVAIRKLRDAVLDEVFTVRRILAAAGSGPVTVTVAYYSMQSDWTLPSLTLEINPADTLHTISFAFYGQQDAA